MAWSPISLFVPQFEATTGLPANGFVLKAYIAGTSTNTPMATDSTGATQVTSIALNADGYPTVSGNIVIPHIDQTFKLALYPTQAAADANTGAKWTIDNLTPITNIQFGGGVNSQTTTYTLLASDEGKLIYYSGAGGVTLDLMTAASAGDGFSFLVENDSSGNVTIDPNGAEQVNGATTLVLAAGQSIIVICTGTAWRALDWSSLSNNNIWPGTQEFSNTVTHSGIVTMSSKSLWLAEGANVVAASDCNIWTTDGNTVHLTGTTTVTDWGTAPQAGASKWIICDAATPLTYNATTNDMNTGGDDYTAKIGDVLFVYARSASSYKITIIPNYGLPGLVKLDSGTVSGTPANVNFVLTGYPTTFKNYLVKVNNWVPATDNVDLVMQFSTDGGSNYDGGAANYGTMNRAMDTSNTAGDVGEATTFLRMSGAIATAHIGNLSPEGISLTVEIMDVTNAASWTGAEWRGRYININGLVTYTAGGGARATAQNTDAFRIGFNSGNIASGTWELYAYN